MSGLADKLLTYGLTIVDCSPAHQALFEKWHIEFCDDIEIGRSSFQGDKNIMIVFALTCTISPEARTTSKFTTSQTKPVAAGK